MKIIVGLGNPGDKYKKTRHNAGFIFVDLFRKYLGEDTTFNIGEWRNDKDGKALICDIKNSSGTKIVLIKPTTFMNLSGYAVQKYISMFKINLDEDLILVHDDLDIKLGSFKIQKDTSPKKHNGVTSVENTLGKTNFLRVRIGVDSRERVTDIPGDKYVLSEMAETEYQNLCNTISIAIKELRDIISL